MFLKIQSTDSTQVNAKAREQRMEIYQKYKKIRDPVYARRNNIISCIPDFWLSIVSEYVVSAIAPTFICSEYIIIFTIVAVLASPCA